MTSETRFYLVAYDIPCDRRRAKVHQLLSGFGTWTQYSVFELFVNDKQMVLLQQKLEQIVNPAEDSVRFYPLCAGCIRGVVTIGSQPPEEPKWFMV